MGEYNDTDLTNIEFKQINRYKSKCIIGDKSIYITDWARKEKDNKKSLLLVRVLMTVFSLVMFFGFFGLAGMVGNEELGIELPFRETVIIYAVSITAMLVGYIVLSRLHNAEEIILRKLKRIYERGVL